MGNPLSENIQTYMIRHKSRSIFRGFVQFMACAVAFATTYALILPAITMEEQVFCGIEEHSHEENCYARQQENHVLTCNTETLQIHTHTENCYDEERLICAQADYIVHAHGGLCFADEQLICTLPERTAHICGESCYEIPDPVPHVHTDSCMAAIKGELICAEEERKGHTHEDSCYEIGTVLCCSETEAHEHGDACYTDETNLICTLEVNHCHEDVCYEPELNCDIQEDPGHTHTDSCYEWSSCYICGIEEGAPVEQDPVLVCVEPVAPVHTHDESCFETTVTEAEPVCGETHEHTYECYELTCQLQTHKHDLPCYSDPNADLESRESWESALEAIVLTGDTYADVVAVAGSQLGYRASERNYAVMEDNTVYGYTRYGEWYGIAYGEWSAMFASFCLHYAGVEGVPYNCDVHLWIQELDEMGLYASAGETEPKPGCLVFFDLEGDGLSDHVGIVEEVIPAGEHMGAEIKTIEGNSENAVRSVTYAMNSPKIIGYGFLMKWTNEPESEPVAQPEATTQTRGPVLCGFESHLHGPVCFGEEDLLICPIQEHNHTIDCVSTASPVGYANSGASVRTKFAMRSEGGIIYHDTDISPLLITIVIEDEEGNIIYSSNDPEVGSEEITLGQTYVVSMLFKETPTNQFGDKQLFYKIPDYLASNGVSDGVIVDEQTGELVAWYTIDGNVLVVTPETDPSYFAEHNDSSINIQFNVHAVFDSGNKELNIDFSDNYTVTITTKENATLLAQKELVGYDPLTRIATFQCVTTAYGGKIRLQEVSDYWWSDAIAKDDYSSVNIPADSVMVMDSRGEDITDQWNVIVDYRSDILARPYDAFYLDHEESITINYQVQFSDKLTTNFQYQNTYYNYGFFNEEPREAMASIITPINFTNVEKQGAPAVETVNNTQVSVLEWRVKITNQDQKSIVITDKLGTGQTFCNHQRILVQVVDPDTGQPQQIWVDWNEIQVNETNTEFTMTLPEGYTNYELVYYSHYTLDANGPGIQNFENTVTTNVTIGDVPTSGTANVGVMSVQPKVDKWIESSDNEWITYTIECFMPAELYNQNGIHLYDTLASWGNFNGHVMQDLHNLTVTITPVDGEAYRLHPYVGQASTDNTYLVIKDGQSFTMLFNTDQTDSATHSVWKCDTASTLTVTYRVPLDAPMLSGWGGSPTEETLAQFLRRTGQNLSNHVKFNYSPTGFLEDTVYFTLPEEEKLPLTKTAQAVPGEDGVYEYSVWFSAGEGEGSIFPLIGDENNRQNDVSDLKLTDIFAPELEYVPGSLRVYLWGYWNHESLVMTYVPRNGKGPTLEMQEDGSTKLTISALDLIGQQGSDTWIQGKDMMFALQNLYVGYQYEFTYRLRVKDRVKDTSTEGVLYMDNTAQVDWLQTDGPHFVGPAECEVSYDTGILKKTMERLGGDKNLLNFSILVNKNALDLAPESNAYILHDTMTPNLTLIYTSLEIEYLDAIGYVTEIKKPEECNFSYNPELNRMTFTLPDSQTIRLKYNCKVNGDGGEQVDVGNVVQLEGYSEIQDIVNTVFQIREHTGSADASSKEFMLQKQDAYSFELLPGVSFELYGDTERAGSKTMIAGGKMLWYYETFTTDENGMVLIKDSQLSAEHMYALREVAPLEGYLPQEEPYLFYMERTPAGVATKLDVVAEGALLVIQNKPISYTLPETGGGGTHWFILGGIGVCLFALMFAHRKRRGTMARQITCEKLIYPQIHIKEI